MFTLINRIQLRACEKQLNFIEFRRKKNIPTILFGVGAQKFTNSCSLLFEMSMISGKRDCTRYFLGIRLVRQTSCLLVRKFQYYVYIAQKTCYFYIFLYFQLSRGENDKTVTYITCYIIRSLSVLFPFTRSTKCSNGIWFRGYGLPSLFRSKH